MQTPITAWPELKCFQHCDRSTNLLCHSVPPVCPLCRHDTATTPSRIPPYILPSPFMASHRAPCSIVLRPTSGDFIQHYTNTADLHIGVTDSSGHCYDFDEDGLHVGGVWGQCVALSMLPQTDHSDSQTLELPARWDQALLAFADPRVWTVHRYDESRCNCFDFVLQFLQRCGLQGRVVGGREVGGDKRTFCQEFLQPHTAKAAQYVALYRRVLKEGCVVDRIKN